MSRALWLLLAAGVAVWAAAFLQVEERVTPAAASEPEPEPTLTEPAPPAPSVPSAPPQSAAAVEAVPVAQPVPAPNVVQPPAPRGLLASATATIRAARDAFIPAPTRPGDGPPAPDQVATGELGEGTSSPEYHAVERAYTHEPRDGAWAANEERLLRFSLRSTPLNQQLALVNCQQTICRMVFERAEANAFEQLVRNPELVKITGLSAASPHSYRSGQLSVYFARRSVIVEDKP